MSEPSLSASGTAAPAGGGVRAPGGEGLRGDSANLDLLRSSAVVFVVLCHLPLTARLFDFRVYQAGALGLLGVVIFFVHTCLVLMLSLRRQDGSQGRRDFSTSFYIRRAFRIYPLSIMVVLAITALQFASTPGGPGAGTVLSNLFLVQNLTGHESIPATLWSLPFEVQMYLLLPALYLLAEKAGPRAKRVVGFLWIGSAALVIVLWRLGLNYHLLKYVPCFLPGVLAYCARETRRTWPPLVLFGYVVACAVLMPLAVAKGARENLVAWPVCFGLGLLIPRCAEVRSGLLRRIGKTIARYSYGLYLVHLHCIQFAFDHLGGRPPALQWGAFIAATAGLSVAAYHLIEKPGIDLGISLADRWARRSRAAAKAAAAPMAE